VATRGPYPVAMAGCPLRVLLVDDDPTLADVVGRYLSHEGFAVDHALTGEDGLARAAGRRPDLVVLDLMLPGLDGMEVCRRLRRPGAESVPVIMLTARGDEADRVAGLELGADDYLAKPFSLRELGARVRAVLRRSGRDRTEREVLTAGELELDVVARSARRSGEAVTLTAKEFDLLAHLMRHPDEAHRRERLLEDVWGWTYGDTATITVHVRRLREKVELDPARPRHLQTVWGVGYRFVP